jgi:hypothetical protein
MPDILYKAILKQHETYDKGNSDLTVTELIKPPWQAALQRKHHDEVTEDADSRIWSLFGSAIHSFIENSSDDQGTAETRYFIKRMGKTISGQIDYKEYRNIGDDLWHTIYDWKVTSAWSALNNPKGKQEWHDQLNLLKLLHDNQQNPMKMLTVARRITDLVVIAFYRDWSLNNYRNDPAKYPQQPYQLIGIPIWSSLEAEKFLLKRIELNMEADFNVNAKSSQLERMYLKGDLICSEEERWHKPDKWAIKKHGNKKATKLFDTEEEALIWKDMNKDQINESRKKYEVEFRPGEDTRCMSYCNVNTFCPHFKQLTKETEKAA